MTVDRCITDRHHAEHVTNDDTDTMHAEYSMMIVFHHVYFWWGIAEFLISGV